MFEDVYLHRTSRLHNLNHLSFSVAVFCGAICFPYDGPAQHTIPI